MTLCTLFHLVVMVLLLSDCSATSDLFCDCHLPERRDTNVAIHCAEKKTGGAGFSCGTSTVRELPPGYQYVPGYGLFKLYRTFKTWEDAMRSCEREGARLAVPEDRNLLQDLQRLFDQEPGVWYAHLGVANKDGVYAPAYGNSTLYVNWGPGDLDGHKSSQRTVEGGWCLVLARDGITDEVPCTMLEPYICQRPQRHVPEDYRWIKEAGRFLRRHDGKKTYDQARHTCEAEGAQLAVADTWHRGYTLCGLLERSYDQYWLGFTDQQLEGDFVTSDGRHLWDMEFQLWGKGEPNNNGDNKPENCLGLSGIGYLNDIRCDKALPFICEIAPL